MSGLTTPARTPLPAGSTLDQGGYRIERLLGEGGFALVYLATQGRWNLQVCIKEFYPPGCQRGPDGLRAVAAQFERRISSGLQAFQDEASTLERFRHPGIVRVLGSFEENGTAYLVQEFLDGITFREGLAQAGPMPEALVLQVAQQVGQALLMVHAAGLVHADLKPDNIFLTREGRYVLLDFGLTRGFLSVDGTHMGGRGLSPGYSPPEQYLKGVVLTPTTDVYGFAATLLALLTGTAPPDAQQRKEGQGIPAMSNVSPRLENALLQALALDPRQRTAGVREFLFQLGLDSTPKASSYRAACFQARGSSTTGLKGVAAVSLHAASRRLFCAGHNGGLSVFSWPEIVPVGEAILHDRKINAIGVSRNGHYVVTGSEAGEVKLSPSDLGYEGLILIQESSAVTSVCFHEELVAVSFANGKCALVGPTLPQPILWAAHTGPAYCVEFHPSGQWLASSGQDGLVCLWEVGTGKLVSELKGHTKSVTSARFSPDGTSLLSGSNDLTVKFWDLNTGQVVRDLRGHTSVVFDARFTSMDNYVLSLAGDHQLRGFSLHSARLVHSYEGRSEKFRNLVVDPQLPLAATVAEDGYISVWDLSV